ncbi:MAG: GNAT family N-acetyltransferase [Pseudomonadota bacterium]
MVELEKPLRLATEADAPQLAELVNFAGEGMPLHVWTSLAKDGEDPWEFGQRRQAKKAKEGEIVVMDFGQGAVAGLTGYVIGPDPEEISADFPAMFSPLQELENQALNTWYINVLACYPEHRRRGYGAQLLRLAEDICQAKGLQRLSLIVASNNTGAKRLYERMGFVQSAKAKCIKDTWDTDMDHWELMLKAL